MKSADLAAAMTAHNQSIDGVLPDFSDARPPNGDDWNDLDKFVHHLLDMLDDVSASAETMLAHFGGQMGSHDLKARTSLVENAREFCDAYLRPEGEVEEP